MKLSHKTRNSVIGQLLVFITTLLMVDAALANPVLGNVAAGQVSVQQAPNSTVVNQSSQQAIINWQSFNIGASEKTHFEQPAGGVALNRINPTQGASQIYGELSATGKLILVNQAGIFFGPGSRVDVGGIIASTSDISDANFLAGKYHFDQPSQYNGSIINQGTIHAAENGLVALVGTGVRNDGTIEAHMGNVVLASGSKFTVDLYGDQLINFSIDEETKSAGVDRNGNKLTDAVKNDGSIIADGGTILMSARTARNVVDNVVNMTGIAQARSVSEKNGVVILDGGDGNVKVSGTIDVSGKTTNASGGTVKILAKKVHIKSTAVIDASGDTGGGEVLIGGNYQGKGPELNANFTRVDQGAVINADALRLGNGGTVIVWADNTTQFHGSISALGGSEGGNGGFVETSGKTYLDVQGSTIDLRAPLGVTGTWLLDPENLTIQAAGTTTASFASNTYTSNVDSSILTVADLEAALASASIIVQTGSSGSQLGDITVSDPIVWSSANSLTLSAHRNVTINAGISNIGTGSLNITADSDSNNTGAIAINNGIVLAGGTLTLSAPNVANSITTLDGLGSINVNNFTLAKGQWTQTSALNPSFNVANDFQLASGTRFIRNMGTVTISGVPYNAIADVFGFQGIGTQNLNNNYALTQDINASVTTNWNSGAGFVPIGGTFTGNLDGQNYVIDGLTINRPTLGIAGVFTTLALGSNSISNIGFTNVNINSGGGTTNQLLGGVAGVMTSGTLNNVFVTGALSQPNGVCCSGGYAVGGLVGWIDGPATIVNSYNDASVNATILFSVGGLVGNSTGGTISSSYNSGAVTGYSMGGLVGWMDGGSISNSYNIGSVTSGNNQAGGIVGVVNSPSTITNVYASGQISGATTQGGIIYSGNANATVTDSFWDTQTTNQPNASHSGALTGTTGLTTAQSLVEDNYTGWDFTNVWFNLSYGGNTSVGFIRPLLRSEFSTTIRNGHQLQLIGMDGSATFNLAQDIDLGSAVLNPADVWGTSLSSGNGFLSVGTFLPDSSSFSGVLDGHGYVVNGLYMNWSTTTAPNDTSPALFSIIQGGTVRNMGLTNVNITAAVNNGGPGPFAFWDSGTIDQVYATGTVRAIGIDQQVIPGGLVSSVINGSITDSYSNVNVIATDAGSNTNLNFQVGGLAGRILSFLGASSIVNSYSTGSVSAPANIGYAGYSIGGFVGLDSGGNTLSNNFWNTQTSGQAASAGATGLTTAQMMSQANFTGWDFSNTGAWGIIEGNTAPFLQAINTGISGTAPSLTSGTVGIAVNGVTLGTTSIDSSGFFYTVARTVDIASNSGILVYLTSGSKGNAVTVQGTQGNAISGLVLDANTVTVGDASTKTISNSSLGLGEGLLYASNGNIIFGTAAGSNLYLGNGTSGAITFQTTATTTYNFDGNIGQYSGASNSYQFNNAVNLTKDTTLQGSSATFGSTLDGAFNLALPLTTTFNGAVGQSTPLTSITSSSPLTINTSAISTTGNQTYNAAVTLAAASSNLSTVSGNIVFNGNLTGAGNDLTLTGTGNNTFTLTNAVSLNNVTIAGGTGTNTLNLATNSATQAWSINATDAGSVALTGITGTLGFSNIQNLVGGSGADSFTLNGGTVGGSIDGAGGSNTLIIPAGETSWVVNGTNAGTVNGITSGFANIQNLTGGTGGASTFTFTGTGSISGVIDGGNTTFINTLDFSNYGQPIALTLNIPSTGTELNSGSVAGQGTFTEIQQAIGTTSGGSTLTLPTKSNITIDYTNGTIGDPFYFSNLTLLNTPAAAPAPQPAAEMATPPFVNEDIAKIITPFTEDSSDSESLLAPVVIVQSMYIEQTINDVLEKEVSLDDEIKVKQSFGCFK